MDARVTARLMTFLVSLGVAILATNLIPWKPDAPIDEPVS
jgi:hypothetical protein